jgi:hypothetical protein
VEWLYTEGNMVRRGVEVVRVEGCVVYVVHQRGRKA